MKKMIWIVLLCVCMILLSNCKNDNSNVTSLKRRDLSSVELEHPISFDLIESNSYLWKSTDGKIVFDLNNKITDIFYDEKEEVSKGIFRCGDVEYNMIVHADSDSIKMTSTTGTDSNFYLEGYYFWGEQFGFPHNSVVLVIIDVHSYNIPFYESDDVILFYLSANT